MISVSSSPEQLCLQTLHTRYLLYLCTGITHTFFLTLSPTTKRTKFVSDYAIDKESREAQHSQTKTSGNSERLPCPSQPQQVETSWVFCISLSCTVINLYMTPRGQVIMVYFQMTHEQVCRKRVCAAQKTGKWNILCCWRYQFWLLSSGIRRRGWKPVSLSARACWDPANAQALLPEHLIRTRNYSKGPGSDPALCEYVCV